MTSVHLHWLWSSSFARKYTIQSLSLLGHPTQVDRSWSQAICICVKFIFDFCELGIGLANPFGFMEISRKAIEMFKLTSILYCVTFCYCEMHLPQVNVSHVNTALVGKFCCTCTLQFLIRWIFKKVVTLLSLNISNKQRLLHKSLLQRKERKMFLCYYEKTLPFYTRTHEFTLYFLPIGWFYRQQGRTLVNKQCQVSFFIHRSQLLQISHRN